MFVGWPFLRFRFGLAKFLSFNFFPVFHHHFYEAQNKSNLKNKFQQEEEEEKFEEERKKECEREREKEKMKMRSLKLNCFYLTFRQCDDVAEVSSGRGRS